MQTNELYSWIHCNQSSTMHRWKMFDHDWNKLFDIDTFDLILIDHYKVEYLRDVKWLVAHDVIESGTVLVADNVTFRGAPTYLEYIRNNPNHTNAFHETLLEYHHDMRATVDIVTRRSAGLVHVDCLMCSLLSRRIRSRIAIVDVRMFNIDLCMLWTVKKQSNSIELFTSRR
jgi:hypothetical protein